MTKRDLNNLSDTELLTRLLRLEEHVLDGRTPDDLTVEEFAEVAEMPTNETAGSLAPVQSVDGETGDVISGTRFPLDINGGSDVSIPANTQQLVAGEITITDGSLTLGDGAELRVL